MTKFYNLHCHSMFSLLDGVSSPKEILQRAKELGQDRIALTDHGTLAGACEFQIASNDLGIKPIFGIEAYFVDDINAKSIEEEIEDKEKKKILQKQRASSSHIVLLAKNQKGLENLYKITYISNTRGYYYRPKIDMNVLEECKDGLIVTTACSGGIIPKLLWEGNHEKLNATLEKLCNMFKEDFFLEIQVHDFEDQKVVNKTLIDIAAIRNDLSLQFVVTNDCHYATLALSKAHAIVKKINIEDWKPNCNKLYIANYDDIKNFYKIHDHYKYMNESFLEEAIKNTVIIANRCNAKIDLESSKIPKFDVPKEFSSNFDFLKHEINDGWKKRSKYFVSSNKDYKDRLKLELEVITSKGYIDYFLIVSDIIKHAKRQDILTGPGRGSVGGSLLAWLLEITEVDPIKYDLSFERFLNPERLKFPDIDTDYPDNQRSVIKEYIAKRWGKDKMASIVSYTRYTANTIFRDVMKQYGYNFSAINELAKTIQTSGAEYKSLISIEKNIKLNPKLEAFFDSLGDKKAEIIEILNNLNGKIKNMGIAAAGTIISDKPIYEIAPVRRAKAEKEEIVTEWEGETLNSAKYLKLDILGLKTLTIIKDTMSAVGLANDFIYNLSLDDPKVYEYFRQGKSETIFQLESEGMKDLLLKIQPENIEDINNIVALYRPLPLTTGGTEKYCQIKAGRLKVESIHPFIDDILAPTLGIPLYQEQVIKIFNRLGLTKGEADLLRKHSEQMNQDKIDFYINKIIAENKSGLSTEELKFIVKKIENYAGYLFNYSHSVQYSIISYWCQYLRVKYPEDYLFNCIKHNNDSPAKIKKYINVFMSEVPNYTIKFCNANNIFSDFYLDKVNKVIFIGISQVKGAGKSSIEKIDRTRKYQTFYDFIVANKKVGKKILSDINKLGFFDDLEIIDGINFNRKQRDVLISQISTAKAKSITDLFKKDNLNLISADSSDFTNSQIDKFFIEIIEFSIQESLKSKFQSIIDKFNLSSLDNHDNISKNMMLLQLINLTLKKTKKGLAYYSVNANDYDSNLISFHVWAKDLDKFKSLKPGTVAVCSIKKDSFGYTFNGKVVTADE